MAKILITGAAGFIGSQLGYRLHNEGHEVVLLDDMSFGYEENLEIDNKKFGTFIKDDIRSQSIFNHMKGVDVVFNFAAISSITVCQEKPYYSLDVNIAGAANVLEAARLNGVRRVIFSSTLAIYENNTSFPVKEEDEVYPNLTYSVSKLQAEMTCKSYSEAYGMEIVVVRYPHVYGPNMDFRRKSPYLIAYIIRELLHNRQPILFSTEGKKNFVYVDDINDLNILCMNHPQAPGQIFNATSETAVSVKEIYQYLAKALDSDIKPLFKNPQTHWDKYPSLFNGQYPLDRTILENYANKNLIGATEKTEKILGWKAKVPIEVGLTRTAEHIKKLISSDLVMI